jgi:predicted AAA+ superfamily ATPase
MESGHAYAPRLVDGRLREYVAAFPAVLITGPRATGKTTTGSRVAAEVVRLDRQAQAAAFEADPDAALRNRAEPLLLDEWQAVPGVLGAVKRAVDADPRPGRFLLTGSVRADLAQRTWPGTGRVVRLPMYGMTEREIGGDASVDGYSFLDALTRADVEPLRLPEHRPDLVEYVDRAMRGGFPTVVLQSMTADMRDAWLDSYVAQLITRDAHELQPGRDSPKLGRYLQALAAHSATEVDHKTLYDAAGIDRRTAAAYDSLLEALFVVEQVQSWDANRLKRLTSAPKRYLVDPSMMAAAIGATTASVLADGTLLGRTIDTFVTAQLRPEVALRSSRTGRYHLRTKSGREEIDILIEAPDGRMIALEVKATAGPSRSDARHLAWLRDSIGDRFIAGAVLHTGPDAFSLGDRILAVPICAIWA